MGKTQFNVKVDVQLQNDFRRACSFDVHSHSGKSKKMGEVLDGILREYVRTVFSRKDVEKELSRLKGAKN